MGTTRLSAEGAVVRGLSPEIWQGYGFIGGELHDPSLRGLYFDDFEIAAAFGSVATVKYAVYLDTGCTFSPYTVVNNANGEWGVMRLTQDGTDNDQVSFQLGGNIGGILKIDPTSAAENNAVVAFECRIRQSSIANTLISWFAGFAEENCSANDGLLDDAATTFADKDYIGFWIDEVAGSAVKFTFHKTSGTAVTSSSVKTAVAATWTKYGFVYDPRAASDKKIKVYVDGVGVAMVSNSTSNGTGDTTNFPGGEEL